MLKKLIFTPIFVFILCFTTQVFGQSYRDKFNQLCEKQDTAGQIKLLNEWEIKQSNDPELYVSFFNYYFQKGKTSHLGIQPEATNQEGLKINDDNGKTVGFISEVTGFDDNEVNKGLDYIDKGIKSFPNRLDMRFGKIFVLGKLKRYNEFSDEVVKTIEYSNINKNAWLWSNNKAEKDGKMLMLGSIQNYVLELYNTNDDALLENMKQIAESVLKYYPDHIESLSNLSIVYMLKNQNDKALEVLLKAEKLDEKDYIVLGNIAQAYKKLGNKKEAIKYYKKCVKLGDKPSVEYAKEQIKILEK
jgi:tetratricopeptide (TPR) repeat protein